MSDIVYTNLWNDYGIDNHYVNIFIGMRGMGKTFSILSGYPDGRYTEKSKLLYARLTSTETRIITSSAGNAFKDINDKKGCKYAFFNLRDDLCYISKYKMDADGIKMIPDGPMEGYAGSIVLLRKVCGIGMQDVGYFVVDEFIPKNRSDYRGEKFRDIMTVWETINRNREADHIPACKLILLSNANDIYDSVLVGFNLVNTAEKMLIEGREHFFDEDRSIALHILKPTESFYTFKKTSAVARATQGTEYGEMAFDNKFAFNDFAYVQALKDYRGSKPMFSLNLKAYFYRLPNGTYYVSYRRAECPDYPLFTDLYRRYFRQNHPNMANLIANGEIKYQSYELKEIVLSALK